MASLTSLSSLAELKNLSGQEVAVSDWTEITQEQVNQFAQSTGDLQWIHVDVERSRRESPYGGTVAHGFLTLSLLPMLMSNAIVVADVKMGINYGLNKVRFPAPVPVASRLRARMNVLDFQDIPNGAQVTWLVTMERENGDKPVCIAETVIRYFV